MVKNGIGQSYFLTLVSFKDGFGKTFYFYSNFGVMKKEERVKTARK